MEKEEVLKFCDYNIDLLADLFSELANVALQSYALHYTYTDNEEPTIWLRSRIKQDLHEDLKDLIPRADDLLLEEFGCDMQFWSKGSYYIDGKEVLFDE